MKRNCFTIIFVLALMSFFSCGAEKSEPEEGTTLENKGEKNIVLALKNEAELEKCAYTFEELRDNVDFIAEADIVEAIPVIYEGLPYVNTELTPEIIDIYKGEYNGEKLVLIGGVISNKEYSVIAENNNISFTDEELDTGYVSDEWFDMDYPEAGDKVIFFGNYSDDGRIYAAYDYQGLFTVDDGSVSISSLTADETGWYEDIAHDLEDNYNAKIELNESGETVTATIDKDILIKTLKQ